MDHLQKNVELAKNTHDYQVSKFIELQRANQCKEEAKIRRKIQEEENLKYRMFQVVKWEIIRKKEKEMNGRLMYLRDKRDRTLTFNAHVLLYSMLSRVSKRFIRLRDKKHRDMKKMMGTLLM